MTRKIVTDFWMKPIPVRQFDWCAYFDGDEPNDEGQMRQGFGRTEAEAILELLDGCDFPCTCGNN